MSISFTYCGVACGVVSVDDKFYIGIDPDLSPKGTLVQFNGFVSKNKLMSITTRSYLIMLIFG